MNGSGSGRPTAQESALKLMERKDLIQAELDTQFAILTSHQATMNTPLVDREGFPRADIDVYAIRLARVRIIELRNDMTSITDDIGKALQGIYDPSQGVVAEEAASETRTEELRGFARVDGVAPGGPAAEAGMRRGDVIVKFGELGWETTGGSLSPLAELVNSHENRAISVTVEGTRDGRRELTLVPRANWGGRGMLGCHLVVHGRMG